MLILNWIYFMLNQTLIKAGQVFGANTGKPFYGLKTKYKTQFSKKLSMELILTLTDKKLPFLNKI